MLRTRNLTLTSTAQELTIDDMVDTPNTYISSKYRCCCASLHWQ
jgi:hypothetical protein